VKKVEELLSNAKTMLEKPKSTDTPDVNKSMETKKSTDKTIIDVNKENTPTSAKPNELPKHLVAPDVDRFLDRLRHHQSFDVTLPELPSAKSFTDLDVDFTMTQDFDSTINSLSESKFRKGLEASIQISSDAE
jgi:hypothetical protein